MKFLSLQETFKKISRYQIAMTVFLLVIAIFGSGFTLVSASTTKINTQNKETIVETNQSKIILALNGDEQQDKDKYGLADAAPDDLKTTESLGTRIGDMINIILGFVGIGLLILMLYGGITWMTSAGNAEKIGQAKKVMIAAVVGFILIFLSYTITKMVANNFFKVHETTINEDNIEMMGCCDNTNMTTESDCSGSWFPTSCP